MEEINIKDIFNIFWAKKVQIILIILIFTILGVLYSYLYVKPKYKVYTTLLLATSTEKKDGEGENKASATTTTDINLNNSLVSTYSVLIKSKPVLREVIEKLNIRETEEELKNNITVSAEKNTQVIKIEVINSNAKVAQDVANEIAKSFAVQVEDIYNINNVHVIEKAEETTTPYNVNHIKDIIMFAFGGFVIAGIYAIIANLLDTTVKTQDDIEKRTGLSVLVSIPMMNSFEDLPKPVKKGGTR